MNPLIKYSNLLFFHDEELFLEYSFQNLLKMAFQQVTYVTSLIYTLEKY